jgi:transcriptional regulator with XRE-family HTH domain
MPTKEQLGRRLRAVRFERGMTLKEVAARAGMSATHISEVERGKTSPTIGALQKIANALSESPSYFVHEDRWCRVLLTKAQDRSRFFLSDSDGRPFELEVLSKGVPCGSVQIFRRLGPPGEKTVMLPLMGEVVVMCLSGMVRIGIPDGESHVLREGDTVQLRIDEGYIRETLGDEDAETLAILATPTLFTI